MIVDRETVCVGGWVRGELSGKLPLIFSSMVALKPEIARLLSEK